MIETLLVKTTAPVPAETPTTYYTIYSGSLGAESDAGFTTKPQAVSRVALGSGTWATLHRVNDGWELQPHSNHCWRVTLGVKILAGATGLVTLPDGRAVLVINWSADTDLAINDKCLCFEDLTNGVFYLIRTGGGSGTLWFKGQLAQNVTSSSATPILIKNLVSVTEGETAPGGNISANNTMGWVGSNNDPCWVIKNTSTDPATWELMSVKWDEITRVKNVKYETGALVQTKEAQIGKKIDPEIDSTILAALSATYVTSIGCNGLQNTWTYETIKYLGESLGDGSGSCTHTVSPPTLTGARAISNIIVSGTQIIATYRDLTVHAAGPEIPFIVHVGTECVESEANQLLTNIPLETQAEDYDSVVQEIITGAFYF